jgi:hypothetical protein
MRVDASSGSEDFWGGKLRLHEAIVGQKLGGVGVNLHNAFILRRRGLCCG